MKRAVHAEVIKLLTLPSLALTVALTWAVTVLLLRFARLGRIGCQILWLRHRGAVRANERGGDLFRAAFLQQLGGDGPVLVVGVDRGEQRLEQAGTVVAANVLAVGGSIHWAWIRAPRSIDSTRLRRG